MELWSKGLGSRVLSLRLGEREALLEKDPDLVIEGVMHGAQQPGRGPEARGKTSQAEVGGSGRRWLEAVGGD